MSNREMKALGINPKVDPRPPASPLAARTPAERHLHERMARPDSAPEASDDPDQTADAMRVSDASKKTDQGNAEKERN